MYDLAFFVISHLIDILLAVVTVSCLLLMWLDFKRWRRRQILKTGFCKKCGYNLYSNESGRCPECGTPIPK